MFRKTFILFFGILLSFCPRVAWAAGPGSAGSGPLAVHWAAFRLDARARAASGLSDSRLAVLTLEPDAGWHAYSDRPGPMGKPTRLMVNANDGRTALPVLYPKGRPEPNPLDAGRPLDVYPRGTPLFVPLPDSAGAVPRLSGRLELLLCSRDECLPVAASVRFAVPGGRLPSARLQPWWPQLLAAAQRAPRAQGRPAASSTGMATRSAASAGDSAAWGWIKPRYVQPELEVGGVTQAVLLGALAGFVLNFMPCVLPVVSIKLAALAAGVGEEDAERRRRAFRRHNLFFAVGILLYFLVLSVLLSASGLAWGQIFQNAAVTLGLAAFIFALALSLFGVFTLPVVDLKLKSMAERPGAQALVTGFWATLLATPCSGPFLGGVLGWTLLQPFWIVGTVFAGIGLGMALPYLLLALFPRAVRLFPAPGAWTGVLEKIVGFLLLGTCVYLLSILPSTRLVPALVLLWLVAVAAWLWGVGGPGLASPRAAILKFCSAGLVAAGFAFVLLPSAAEPPPPASFAAVEFRRALGRENVLVDFTADWCPTCKALERTTLKPDRLREFEGRYGIRVMRADLTGSNPEAEGLLHALGSQSIPVVAVFPKNAPDRPFVLRDLFTPEQFEAALKKTVRP